MYIRFVDIETDDILLVDAGNVLPLASGDYVDINDVRYSLAYRVFKPAEKEVIIYLSKMYGG